MARPAQPERNRAARSFGQLRRFHHRINSDNVFGTHKCPSPNRSADARQRFWTGSGHEAVSRPSVPHRLPGSKLEPEKVEMCVGKVAPPVRILAIDDLRLLGMQLQLASRKARL